MQQRCFTRFGTQLSILSVAAFAHGQQPYVNQVSSPLSVGPLLDIGDMDSDGDVDLVCGLPWNGATYPAGIAWNDGTTHFALGTPFTGELVDAAVGDLDGDSRLDLVTFHGYSDPRIEVHLQTPQGTFAAPLTEYMPGSLYRGALTDVDGDGDLDVVAARGGTAGTIHKFLNDGVGGLISGTSQSSGSGVNELLAVDIDGDGFGDVLCAHADGRWRLRWGSASGMLSAPVQVPANGSVLGSALGDFDGDGALDLAGTTLSSTLIPAVRWWRQTSPRSFVAQPQLLFAYNDRRYGRTAVDVDYDGRSEFLVDDGYSELELFSVGSTGLFASQGSFDRGIGNYYVDFFTRDFDGDLFVDVAWALTDGAHVALHNGPVAPAAYCTAKINSQGCTPSIGSTGAASATSLQPFTVSAQQVINQKSGLLFYGSASLAAPFQGGTMCVASPTRRTSVQSSNGNPSPDDCSGAFALDFNAVIQSGVDPALVPTVYVYAQWWHRDPASPSTTGLSDGLRFQIGP